LKCRICGSKAEVHLRSHNIALCREDFVKFFERRLLRTVRRFRMFGHQDRVLVAVSGGKDSLGLLHALKKLGYKVAGYHIYLDIDGYSERSLERVEAFARMEEVEIRVEGVEEALGCTIVEASEKLRRPICSLCGTVKRYLMNRAAEEFDVLATGHNLDDEAATLLGNLLHWQEGYLERQGPVLKEGDGFRRKVKPLSFTAEYETAVYAFLEGIDYIVEECPYARGATSIFYKDVLGRIEEKMPGTKIRFLGGFYKFRGEHLKPMDVPLRLCTMCGYPTTGEVCNFCKLKERLNSRTTESEQYISKK